jgi:antitoxin component of MazEF toxin-antitoxin module
MIMKLTKHGDEYALILDRSTMDSLHIKPETALEVTTAGGSLVVTPAGHDAELDAALKAGNARYGRMLKRLGGNIG